MFNKLGADIVKYRDVLLYCAVAAILLTVGLMIPAAAEAQNTLAARGAALLPSAGDAFSWAAGELASSLQGILFNLVIWPFAQILNGMVYILILVGQYNGFAGESIVRTGWETLRDLSNMFFVLVMLIISIGTITKWQKVNHRQNLRRLILMALLINFSKTIVVFMIDFSQVIMLTFLSAVQSSLQGGFITLLGIDTIVQISAPSGIGEAGAQATVGLVTFIVTALMMVIACIVVAVILIIFIARIIALWFIIITAPIAFLASTLPQTSSYYDQWWKMLGQNLVAGPALAFMLWLVISVATGGVPQPVALPPGANLTVSALGGLSGGQLINFLVGIGLLFYSIRLTSTLGAAGASVASRVGNYGLSKLQAGARRVGFGKSGEGGVYGRVMTGVTKPAAIAMSLPRLIGDVLKDSGATARKASERKEGFLARSGLKAVGALSTGLGHGFNMAGRVTGSTLAERKLRVAQQTRLGKREQAERADISQMSYDQRKDLLKSIWGKAAFRSQQAALVGAMARSGHLDRYAKELQEEEGLSQDEANREIRGHMRRFYQASGMSQDEIESFEEKHYRYADLENPETQERIKKQLGERRRFDARDQRDQNFAKKAGEFATSLGAYEMKKFMDTVPPETYKSVAEGMKQSLLQYADKPGDSLAVRRENKNRRSAIFDHLDNYDPGGIREREAGIEEDAAVRRRENRLFRDPAEFKGDRLDRYNNRVSSKLESLGPEQIAKMSNYELERDSALMSSDAIIKSQGHNYVAPGQRSAQLRGLVVNFGENFGSVTINKQTRETFDEVWDSSAAGNKLRDTIRNVVDELQEAVKRSKDGSDEQKQLQRQLANALKAQEHSNNRRQEQPNNRTNEGSKSTPQTPPPAPSGGGTGREQFSA